MQKEYQFRKYTESDSKTSICVDIMKFWELICARVQLSLETAQWIQEVIIYIRMS